MWHPPQLHMHLLQRQCYASRAVPCTSTGHYASVLAAAPGHRFCKSAPSNMMLHRCKPRLALSLLHTFPHFGHTPSTYIAASCASCSLSCAGASPPCRRECRVGGPGAGFGLRGAAGFLQKVCSQLFGIQSD